MRDPSWLEDPLWCAKEHMRSVAHVLRTRHGGGTVNLVFSRKSGGAVRAPGNAGDKRVKRKRGSRSAAAVAARIEPGDLKRIRTAGSTACVNNHVDFRGTGTDGSSHPAAERTSVTARDTHTRTRKTRSASAEHEGRSGRHMGDWQARPVRRRSDEVRPRQRHRRHRDSTQTSGARKAHSADRCTTFW